MKRGERPPYLRLVSAEADPSVAKTKELSEDERREVVRKALIDISVAISDHRGRMLMLATEHDMPLDIVRPEVRAADEKIQAALLELRNTFGISVDDLMRGRT